MTFAEMRELVRVRHELRRAAAEGRRDDARRLIAQLRALAERDPHERQEMETELRRWEMSLGA